MRSYLFIVTPLLLTMSLLVGCTAKSVNGSNVNNKALMPSVEYDYDKQLKQCITESDFLAKKDKSKYGSTNDALIQMLSGIKSYSSQLSQIDEKNKEIITSMYVYQVNDLCNSISQVYLTEVKKDLDKIVGKIKIN